MTDLAQRVQQLSAEQRMRLAGRLRPLTGPDTAGERLVAYVVPKAGRQPAPGELQAFVQAKVPAYMVPSDVVLLEALPRTANGKVDRRALPAPAPAPEMPTNGLVAPRTPDEQTLAGLWADALGFDRIGVHDDFFELGGHSLLAVRLLGQIRETFAVDLPMRALFEAPTIAELAVRIDQARASAESSAPADGIGRVARDAHRVKRSHLS